MSREGRTTLRLIASAAGVSQATVSKVVNNRHDVAPQTRARIQRLLEQHGYAPPARPRSGALIDLAFAGLDGGRLTEILRGVVSTGVEAVVSSIADDPSPQDWARRLVESGRCGAIVLASDALAAQLPVLDRARLPYVVIDLLGQAAPEAPSVGATNWAGARSATRHLLDLGHRRIGLIGGPMHPRSTRARLDGYHAALGSAGVPGDPELLRHASLDHTGGYDCARALLDLPVPPTAIVAGDDEQALGVVEAARVLGIAVPDGLSVVGFDDLAASRWASPALTTVRQPFAEMGRVAAGMLQALVEGRPLGSNRVELATSLVVRRSTAAPAVAHRP